MRGADGVLGGSGGAGPSGEPADLDSVLSVLPADEAARWKATIEADGERQDRMTAAPQPPGFSDAYSALRAAGGRSASSGLLGILGGGGAEEEEREE